MGLQTSFDVLSRIVERHETNGRTVRNVTAASEGEGDALHVSMTVPLSLGAAPGDGRPSERSPEVTLIDDGGVRVEFPPSALALPAPSAATVSATEQSVTVAEDGLRLTVDLTIDPADAETHPNTTDEAGTDGVPVDADGSADDAPDGRTDRSIEAEGDDPGAGEGSAAALEAVRDEALPPYEDTEYLRGLYDSCDTFEEMSRTIEMDVSAETVRRYLIEAGVHEPTSYRTGAGDDPEPGPGHSSQADPGEADQTPGPELADRSSAGSSGGPDDAGEPPLDDQFVTDGLGLPEDLRIEDVVDAVVESTTLYDVQRHLDLERGRTRELLEHLNLLDLVMHRISEEPKREVSYGEVATRIRQCTATGA
jgi:hypothetical protein